MKCRIVSSSFAKNQEGTKCFKAAYHQQSVKAVLLEFGSNGAKVNIRLCAVRSKLRPPSSHPVVDPEPREFIDVVVEQTAESILYGKRRVTLANTVPHGSSGSRIHTACRGSDAKGG
jgi:hypothetical protein